MRIILLLSVLLLFGHCYATEQELTPDGVISAIKVKGARAVVDDLWRNYPKWKQFLDGVSSGHPKWLKAAYAISPGTDAGSSEDLGDALSRAFLKAPYDQLVVDYAKEIKGKKPLNEICYMGWDGEYPGGVEDYIEKAKLALSKRQAEQLEPIRNACLKGLNHTLADFKAATIESSPNPAFKRDALKRAP
ncbi:MAG: hypothetical protein B7Y56_15750 [Gallionellales bacterium 35-53-114]|jgi:hypothetical protein|nr:MAG: hypothetical protein B7Y56_15750 [Gallionellales bacterium 35-53-114]OYZ62108.1 MAG: hypothetical protein B7Y04_15290 [Gallionellales bacterium 24-53-125]HQS59818.1 hypothetical protein [Gallionellaceae bacterium]HQS76572.1 hypothetical protein [Gallionellaceae bacterium]